MSLQVAVLPWHSHLAPPEYRRLYKEFSGMFPDDNFYESYRIALEKGVRKPNRTKSKVARKLKRKIQAASRKMNTGTKGHTALR